jgi:hypothetical protein
MIVLIMHAVTVGREQLEAAQGVATRGLYAGVHGARVGTFSTAKTLDCFPVIHLGGGAGRVPPGCPGRLMVFVRSMICPDFWAPLFAHLNSAQFISASCDAPGRGGVGRLLPGAPGRWTACRCVMFHDFVLIFGLLFLAFGFSLNLELCTNFLLDLW